MQRIKSRRVIAVLEEHGGYLIISRWINHRPYMPTEVSAGQLQTRLLADGFSLEVHANAVHKDVTVDCRRVDRPAEIDLTVISALDLVRSLGGTYNGWGCEVDKGAAWSGWRDQTPIAPGSGAAGVMGKIMCGFLTVVAGVGFEPTTFRL
ncbi:ribonuclease E inhibitor RraB [Erythrobacter ramosus]